MDPTIIYGSLVAVTSAAFAFLLRDREQWISRYDKIKETSDGITASAVKLAESVPDLTKSNLDANIENAALRKRIAELEK